ncbi:hypothetical protein HK14_03165 [Acetobacter cibinongensis]|uniref:Uncharacterized protein n=1 Tax=Acetobacter cibinongensis TaxID=146475 RepID=A0A1Z5YW30_9PROT|nr:hypothetical protein HK14_03165 [Acetobacter cibinongensis]
MISHSENHAAGHKACQPNGVQVGLGVSSLPTGPYAGRCVEQVGGKVRDGCFIRECPSPTDTVCPQPLRRVLAINVALHKEQRFGAELACAVFLVAYSGWGDVGAFVVGCPELVVNHDASAAYGPEDSHFPVKLGGMGRGAERAHEVCYIQPRFYISTLDDAVSAEIALGLPEFTKGLQIVRHNLTVRRGGYGVACYVYDAAGYLVFGINVSYAQTAVDVALAAHGQAERVVKVSCCAAAQWGRNGRLKATKALLRALLVWFAHEVANGTQYGQANAAPERDAEPQVFRHAQVAGSEIQQDHHADGSPNEIHEMPLPENVFKFEYTARGVSEMVH